MAHGQADRRERGDYTGNRRMKAFLGMALHCSLPQTLCRFYESWVMTPPAASAIIRRLGFHCFSVRAPPVHMRIGFHRESLMDNGLSTARGWDMKITCGSVVDRC